MKTDKENMRELLELLSTQIGAVQGVYTYDNAVVICEASRAVVLEYQDLWYLSEHDAANVGNPLIQLHTDMLEFLNHCAENESGTIRDRVISFIDHVDSRKKWIEISISNTELEDKLEDLKGLLVTEEQCSQLAKLISPKKESHIQRFEGATWEEYVKSFRVAMNIAEPVK